MCRICICESLAAVGINLKEHDIRFEEDNWESPTLGAWGIGWQVLLDGQEITQFTYFQQSGGQDLDPISVEMTYGLDRIASYLQGVDNVFDVRWSETVTYRQVRLAEEQQFSAYSFDYADAVSTRKQFELAEAEAARLLAAYAGLKGPPKKGFPILQAYDLCFEMFALFQFARCARRDFGDGARGDDRARAEAGDASGGGVAGADCRRGAGCGEGGRVMAKTGAAAGGKSRGDFLFEIGCEEIPAGMILKASQELKALLEKQFLANGLLDEKSAESSIETFGAPRRLMAIAREVRMRQEDVMREITGPPKSVAYDDVGEPTRAAMSFAEKQGMPVSKLSIVNTPKGEYLSAKQVVIGRPAAKILGEVCRK